MSAAQVESHDAEHVFTEGLRRFVAARVPPADVDDVLQQAHLKLLERPAEVRHLSGYVHRVVRSVIVDYHRRRPTPTAPLPVLASEGEDEGEEDEVAQEVASWLSLFVATLPSPHRETLELTELQGLTHAEAAARLGVPRSTVTSRVVKGRAIVRERLERCCHIELDARRRVVGYEARADCCE